MNLNLHLADMYEGGGDEEKERGRERGRETEKATDRGRDKVRELER